MPEHTPAPSPSRAVYGFVMYLTFRIFFIMYVLWAVIPEEYFIALGITFLPQRYWAIAVPIYFLTVLTTFAFFIYPGFGLCMTPGLDDMRTIKDKESQKRSVNKVQLNENVGSSECICKDKENCYKEFYDSIKATTIDKSIPMLRDLEIWEVSQKLYCK